MVLTTNPHPAPRLKKEYSYTSTPSLCLRGLSKGELYLILRLHHSTGASKLSYSKLRTEESHTLGATVPNLMRHTTWRPGFIQARTLRFRYKRNRPILMLSAEIITIYSANYRDSQTERVVG